MAWSSLTIICCQHGHFYIICIGLCLLYIFGNWLCLLYIFCICVVVFCKSFVWALFCLYLLGIFVLVTFANVTCLCGQTSLGWCFARQGIGRLLAGGSPTGGWAPEVLCKLVALLRYQWWYSESINKLVTLWRGASRWDHICDRWASLGRFLSK